MTAGSKNDVFGIGSDITTLFFIGAVSIYTPTGKV